MFKLAQDRTKSLLAIHGWSAVSLGLLLYVIILTGVASVLARELGDWSSPLPGEQRATFPVGTDAALRAAAATIDPKFHEEVFAFPRAGDRLWAFFHTHVTDEDGETVETGVQVDIDPRDGRILERRVGTGEEISRADTPNALADFFVELHVQLHVPEPWGLLLTGILGFAMMIAAVTGFVLHRHLIRELFTLRRRDEKLLAARDRHVVAATWNLPFAFVLAFTGSYFSFAIAFGLPAMAHIKFGGDEERMFAEVFGTTKAEDRRPAGLGNLDAILADSRKRSGSEPSFFFVEHWGRADATVTTGTLPLSTHLFGATYEYDGPTGAFVRQVPSAGRVQSVGGTMMDLMGALHFGNFAGIPSKLLWVAMGLCAAFVSLTGLRLWTTRRADNPGWMPLARATAWVGYGLPLAMAAATVAYFGAVATGTTAATVMMTAFITTSALLLAFTFRAHDPWAGGRRMMLTTAVVLMLLPFVRWWVTGTSWLDAARGGLLTVIVMDLALAMTGAYTWRATRRRATLPEPATGSPSLAAAASNDALSTASDRVRA